MMRSTIPVRRQAAHIVDTKESTVHNLTDLCREIKSPRLMKSTLTSAVSKFSVNSLKPTA